MYKNLKNKFDNLPIAIQVVIVIGLLFFILKLSMGFLMILPLLVLLLAILVPIAIPIFLGYMAYRLLKGDQKAQLR